MTLAWTNSRPSCFSMFGNDSTSPGIKDTSPCSFENFTKSSANAPLEPCVISTGGKVESDIITE